VVMACIEVTQNAHNNKRIRHAERQYNVQVTVSHEMNIV
jgi:hypothetical protein